MAGSSVTNHSRAPAQPARAPDRWGATGRTMDEFYAEAFTCEADKQPGVGHEESRLPDFRRRSLTLAAVAMAWVGQDAGAERSGDARAEASVRSNLASVAEKVCARARALFKDFD